MKRKRKEGWEQGKEFYGAGLAAERSGLVRVRDGDTAGLLNDATLTLDDKTLWGTGGESGKSAHCDVRVRRG